MWHYPFKHRLCVTLDPTPLPYIPFNTNHSTVLLHPQLSPFLPHHFTITPSSLTPSPFLPPLSPLHHSSFLTHPFIIPRSSLTPSPFLPPHSPLHHSSLLSHPFTIPFSPLAPSFLSHQHSLITFTIDNSSLIN